jgi:plastocyanin
VRRLTIVLVIGFLAAGCGGDDDDDVTAAATSTTRRPAVTSTTASTSSSTTTSSAVVTSTSTTALTTSTATPTTAAPAATTTAAPPPPTTTTAAPPPAAPAEVSVRTTGFEFVPASLSAPAGEIRFSAANDDSAAHTFTIDGTAIDIALAPGGSGSATTTLAAGGYDFRCRIHANMTGTLTVS